MNEVIIKVEGMMCAGCENRVRNALSEFEGIEKVEPNHKEGTVKIFLSDEVAIKTIEEKIEDLGFTVL